MGFRTNELWDLAAAVDLAARQLAAGSIDAPLLKSAGEAVDGPVMMCGPLDLVQAIVFHAGVLHWLDQAEPDLGAAVRTSQRTRAPGCY